MTNRIRELREAKMAEDTDAGRWTQAALADRIGAHISTFQRWEAGQTMPRPFYRRRLARQLGVDVDDLGLGDH